MKRILIFWMLCLVTITSHAQMASSNWIFSGEVSYQQKNVPRNSNLDLPRGMDLNIRSRIGMKISDAWFLGIQAGLHSYNRISPGKPGLAPYYLPSSSESIYIEKIYHGTEANNLLSVGPYVQRFIPLGERTYLHFLASIEYQQGRGGFTPELFISPLWMGDLTLASSYLLPTERNFTERNIGAGLQMGLSHFFTNRIGLDINVGLVEWQRSTIEDSELVFLYYDPYITRSENLLSVLPQRLGLRMGIMILL